MKVIWLALAAVLLAGCAVVPVPAPYASPGVSVGVGVPVYGPYRGYPYRHRHYPYRHGPYRYRHWH